MVWCLHRYRSSFGRQLRQLDLENSVSLFSREKDTRRTSSICHNIYKSTQWLVAICLLSESLADLLHTSSDFRHVQLFKESVFFKHQ